jgi:hypothetical protein
MTLINLAARFVLELVGVGAVGLWAASIVDGMPARLVVGIGAGLAFVVVWALVVAPKADNAITQDLRVLIGSALLLVGAGGLALAGQPGAAGGFAVAIVLNTVLLFVLPGATPSSLATGLAHPR